MFRLRKGGGVGGRGAKMRGLTDIDIAILTDALLPTPTREEIEEFGIDTFPEHDELKCRAAERLLREDRIVVALDLGNGDRWFNVTAIRK